MLPAEAAKLLDLPADATPEQLEARFHELRAKLEDKIAKAPTPGLKAKYRETLDGITIAFETLALASDSSSLPVLRREQGEGRGEKGNLPQPETTRSDPAPSSLRPAPAARRKSGREFMLVAIIAVVVLGAGGWFIMKTRAENAEKARIAAEAKAETDRQAAAAKAEAERKIELARQEAEARKLAVETEKIRQETLFAQLRASQAEFKIRWDSLEKEVASAERELSELKSDTRNTRDLPAPQVAELLAQYAAQGDYVEWIQPYVSRHPVRTELARLDALLGAKAVDDAAALVAALTQSLAAAEAELAAQKKSLLALTGPVTLTSEPAGLAYTFTDAYGRTAQGTTPFDGGLPLGALAVKIQRGRGWADYEQKFRVKRGEPLVLNAEFGQGTLEVNSNPGGLDYEVRNAAGYSKRGTTPAELAGVPSGEVSIRVVRQNWPDIVQTASVPAKGRQKVLAEFLSGALTLTTEPDGAQVFSGGKQVGVTPVTLTDLIPGEHSFDLQLAGYLPDRANIKVAGEQITEARVVLQQKPPAFTGKPFTVASIGLTLVPISAGTFSMGSENHGADEKPVTQVTLTAPYWLGQHEVTQAQWTALMGSNPSYYKGENLPVDKVSWNDAMAFCRTLTKQEKDAGRLPEGYEFSLPTEAQWEYACRAGTTGDHAGDFDRLAWRAVGILSGMEVHPVGQKQPNAWGLYDMHGNVWEWCLDWHGPYPGGRVSNPTGSTSGTKRIFRSGGWASIGPAFIKMYTRTSNRGSDEPDDRSYDSGLRLALIPVH